MYFRIPKETTTLDFTVYLQGTCLESMDLWIAKWKGQMVFQEFVYSEQPLKSADICQEQGESISGSKKNEKD